MKLRILENSIRFRLSVHDLESLSEHGTISSSIRISHDRTFTYTLQSIDKISVLSSDFVDDEVLFCIPKDKIKRLCDPGEVGIYDAIKHNDLVLLNITIEKDFKCLTPRAEDESDLFPNPNESHTEC